MFVDPKGEAHSSSYHKIDGYRNLFAGNGGVRSFKHKKWKVSVNLLFYNSAGNPLDAYRDHWISEPSSIFAGA